MKLSAFVVILSLIMCLPVEAQMTPYSEQVVTSPEVWTVNGKSVSIKATLITGAALFTVQAYVNYIPDRNDAKDRLFAKELVEYAMSHGYVENARLYNNYSDYFHVYDDVFAVALVKVLDEKTGKVSAAPYAFRKEDLARDQIPINPFPLPATFTDAERLNLRNRIQTICNSRSFDQLYSLLSKKALADIPDLAESKKRFKVQMSMSKDLQIGDSDFTVYIGSKGGIRGYNCFIPVAIVPYADPTKKLRVFFKVVVIDQPSKSSSILPRKTIFIRIWEKENMWSFR